ncbi:MAG TPA: hypothetical protein VMD59_00420, partial [Acidimicrobiales bacterium]|nr:hypothetical protein [Acidimicrobiales bacterium]
LVLLVAAAMSTGAFLALTLGDASQLDVYLSLGLLGAGIGLALSAMSNVIVEAVPFSQTGVASGMNANIRTIGGSIGAAVMASIVTSGSRAGGLPRASGYTNGFAMLTAATLLAALATLTIPALRRPDRSGGLEAARSLVLQPSVGEPAMTELPAALATSEGSGSV